LWAAVEVDVVAGFEVELAAGCWDEDDDQEFWCQALYFGSCACSVLGCAGATGLATECADCTGC